jgi:hypothetical protein
MKSSQQPNNIDLLFLKRGINMNVLTDQALNINGMYHYGGSSFPFEKFIVTDIRMVWVSGAANVTPIGGIFTATGGGGSAIVAAAQTWPGLASGKLVTPPLAALCATDIQTVAIGASALYLTLTTTNSGAMTTDLYVYGIALY